MDKKKLAAAMAAVFAYIKTSEEAAAYAAGAPEAGGPMPAVTAMQASAPALNNVWGISGRQSHMQANTMMQLRMFK